MIIIIYVVRVTVQQILGFLITVIASVSSMSHPLSCGFPNSLLKLVTSYFGLANMPYGVCKLITWIDYFFRNFIILGIFTFKLLLCNLVFLAYNIF